MPFIICVYITLFCLTLNTQAQDDFAKIQTEFEKMVKDPKNLYGKNKAAGHYYTLRGITLYAEVYGQGKPLLLIHGNGGSISNF